jgi:outer membrane lipoprotein-sorting protein
MKAAFLLLILFLLSALPTSAADSQVEGTGSAHIVELYSDIESFDVTLYSSGKKRILLWRFLLSGLIRMKMSLLHRNSQLAVFLQIRELRKLASGMSEMPNAELTL